MRPSRPPGGGPPGGPPGPPGGGQGTEEFDAKRPRKSVMRKNYDCTTFKNK